MKDDQLLLDGHQHQHPEGNCQSVSKVGKIPSLSISRSLSLSLCVCVFISLSFLEKLQHTLFRWPRISHFSTPWLRVREVSIQVNWRITWARFPFFKEVSLSHKTRLRFLHGDNYTYSKFQNKVRLYCAVSTVAFVCFY